MLAFTSLSHQSRRVFRTFVIWFLLATAAGPLRSGEPVMSPAWSPDGKRLAYVSFESGKPVVYVHTLASGQRQAVANLRGSNSAPAWSPDGRMLAVTLTREGLSQVFLQPFQVIFHGFELRFLGV